MRPYDRERRAASNMERFVPKMGQTEDSAACWQFTGYVAPNGYGTFGWRDRPGQLTRNIGAHVASFRLFVGFIPKGRVVMHTCDNPACVNPQHLRLGTHADNMSDCVSKRRTARGERQHRARMTAAKVRDLRRRYGEGETQVSLAERFGISQPTVSQIVLRKTWKHTA